jgi:hypothetical protein
LLANEDELYFGERDDCFLIEFEISIKTKIIMDEPLNPIEPKCIRIWSYNVFLRPPPIKNNNDDYKSERFALIVELIHKYDIVCFQELFQTGSFRVEDMIASGIKEGEHNVK